jgi:TRAP-type C4-dicarboxylate transport system permease small subunit
MDLGWMQIGSALLLVMFLVVMWPAYRWWSKNSPKAEEGDWSAAILALVGVIAFVGFLIYLVRS